MERRRSRAISVMFAVLVAISWCSAGVARAAITSFTLSPTSGPPGTVVKVSGTDCSPGLTRSASSDYAAVAAPTLKVSIRIPVGKTGAWHGSFRVPADATSGLETLVVALCVSDGLPLLTTLYTPQTFTVTTPTTTTRPTTTTPGGTTPTTPTTKKPNGITPPTHGGGPSPDGGGGSASTVPVFGGLPPGTSGASTGGGSGKARPGTTKAALNRATAAARAADLSVPELPAAHVAGASRLGWLSWLLLFALIIAAVGAPLWLRRSRRSDEDDTAAVVGMP